MKFTFNSFTLFAVSAFLAAFFTTRLSAQQQVQQQAQAQQAPTVRNTLTYSIDTLSRDSFFLVETVYSYIDGMPRPQIQVNQKLFRSTIELDGFLVTTSKEASDYAEQAERLATLAQVSALRKNLLAELREKEPWWNGKPIKAQPVKQ
jgi:predicted membrane metal-binding protein